MTEPVHIETTKGHTIVLDYDGEIYLEIGSTRHSAWPNLETVREIAAWAENRIDYEEKPLREERDKWAFKLYNMPYTQLDFGGPRDIVDKVVTETTELLN